MPASKSPQKRGVLVFGWGFLVMLTAYCENQILNSILARLSGKLREKTPCLRGMQGIWGNRKGWRILVHSIGNSQLNFIPSLCYHSPPLEVSLKIIIIINIELLYEPAIPQLGINPEKTIIQKNTSTPMFTAAQFIIARIRKQPKCSLIHESAQKLWYILPEIPSPPPAREHFFPSDKLYSSPNREPSKVSAWCPRTMATRVLHPQP